MSILREQVTLKNEMINSGIVFCLVKDIVTHQIDTSFQAFPADVIEFVEYDEQIKRQFEVLEPEFINDVVLSGIARYKSCRRQGRDYWGRHTDPLFLW